MYGSMYQCIEQLPHIARPLVNTHRPSSLLSEIYVQITYLGQDMSRQKQNIISPFAQGRHINAQGIYPIIKVLPESPLPHHCIEISVSCRNEPKVNFNR